MEEVARILDANLNRLREGLRVLEEVARFALEDEALTQDLKGWRHRFGALAFGERLLSSRRAEADVGAFLPTPSPDRPGLADLVAANARRCQEALRVLEEFERLPQAPSMVSPATCQEARFALYELEKTLIGRLGRREKASRIRGLYVIVDPEASRGRSEVEVARAALAGGAQVLQLRAKNKEKGLLLPLAVELKALCAQAGALFIVNDHPDLAMACGADAVHLGQKDLPVRVVRALVPLEMLVGCSANNPQEARQAQEEGADYVGVGAIFPTATKADTRPASLETIVQVKAAVSMPVVAIGGINQDNLAQVIAAGADAAAVISAVGGAPDMEAAARSLVARIEETWVSSSSGKPTPG